jgi:MFS family permease
MQQVAIAWHLYNLTGSAFQVGLVSFFGVAPFLVLSFVGGAIADQFDRKRILIFSQVLTMLSACVLAAATFTGHISAPLIFGISFASGMTRAFDAPARQALIPNLVPLDELANALTLNTMLRQLATIVGPGLGGIVLGFLGVGATYAINAASFLAIIGALLMMGPVAPVRQVRRQSLELALGGLRFVRGENVILSIFLLDFLVNLLGSTRGLLPVFAAVVLDINEEKLGLLYSASAVGAVAGALVLGTSGGRWSHPVAILIASAAFGLFTVGFGLSTVFVLSLLMLFGTGVADVIGEVMRSTIVQLRTPNELRGRVTSLTVIFTNGGPQLGQLQAGAIASALGPAEAALIGGIGVLASVAAFSLNPAMRRPAPPVTAEAMTAEIAP